MGVPRTAPGSRSLGLGASRIKRKEYALADGFLLNVVTLLATYRFPLQILTHLTPLFFTRFPHPVSFGGTLEMGRCFLPIDDAWPQFINNCDETYKDLELEQTKILKRLSGLACRSIKNEKYKEDPWLWDLNWNIGTTKFCKMPREKTTKKDSKPQLKNCEIQDLCARHGFTEDMTKALFVLLSSSDLEAMCPLDFHRLPMLKMLCRVKRLAVVGSKAVLIERLRNLSPAVASEKPSQKPSSNDVVECVLSTGKRLSKAQNCDMLGYPEWYRETCERWKPEKQKSKDFCFGPILKTRVQFVPKLLQMCWKGFALHFIYGLGWGYLLPGSHPPETQLDQRILALCEEDVKNPNYDSMDVEVDWEEIEKRFNGDEKFPELWEAVKASRLSGLNDIGDTLEEKVCLESDRKKKAAALGPFPVVPDLPYCKFYKIPNPLQTGSNVGSPLSKNFQGCLADGTLGSKGQEDAKRVLEISRITAFWISIRNRIKEQMVVNTACTDDAALASANLPRAILPRVVVAGTITRRAADKTWLTASNPRRDRIGSEMKAMVRTPPGWHFVGADVDSQELWIASLLGDAHFCRQHGCTALGWMLLQGRREDGTDMHSRTAVAAGCTRNEAKVLNYARIYGCGLGNATNMLADFNPALTPFEAKENARKMFKETKGIRQKVKLKSKWDEDYDDDQTEPSSDWFGGTESHMFNKLESIAKCPEPTTPVLGARISLPLEPGLVGKEFLRSRINWVVQSSGVDYLHLLLVGVRYLFDVYDIRGRISLSIHDEVRFLVASKDRYRAALALQIVNLWTRALFSSNVGIDDLPSSVAFFSGVEIDSVLRKDPDDQVVTPSNPEGISKELGVGSGETLDIYQLLAKTNRGRLEKV